MARVLMFQGTGSDVGKSTVVAGLGRALVRRGLRVRPFKPQNMSNNAAVTPDGGEIGRAQALQAQACRQPASVHMNPILLKPESDARAQLVVQGRRVGVSEAHRFGEADLLDVVLQSFAHLQPGADLILVEGAGSASEVNLRARDVANWRFARAVKAPVILVGDIDRGGVIASLVGTKQVILPEDAAAIRGFIINKLRGDARLFDDGVAAISRHTGWPCFGVLPWVRACAGLPAEDAVVLERRSPATADDSPAPFLISVLHLPSIANFDDLDPLRAEPSVRLSFLEPGDVLSSETQLVIIPGSKATRADLTFLRAQGWDIDLQAHARRGGRILGLCGGFQMLGRAIHDPEGLEGAAGSSGGLGLLDVETTLLPRKTLRTVSGRHTLSHASFTGYEIHLGHTDGPDTGRPWAWLDEAQGPARSDGATSRDGRIAGSYVHGSIASDALRAWLLSSWGAVSAGLAHEAQVETALDALADAIEANLDVPRLLEQAR